MVKEYIEREAVCYQLTKQATIDGQPRAIRRAAKIVADFPAADVLPRDEAIKMGAELAAMHGSDATSQQLEEVYLKGVEYGMTRRDVRPVVLCKDCVHFQPFRPHDGFCKIDDMLWDNDFFCANGKREGET